LKLKEPKSSRKLVTVYKHHAVVIEEAEVVVVAPVVVTDPEVIVVVEVVAAVIDLANQDQKAKLMIDQEVIDVAVVAVIDPELLYQTLTVKKLAQLLLLIVQNALKNVVEVEVIEVPTNSKVNLVKMLTH
jgi:hypothetical protein